MPKVMIVQSEPIAFKDDITVKFDGGGVAFALDTMHRQQLILVPMEKHDDLQNEILLRGGVKRRRPSTAHTTKEPAHETERSVRYWQKNLFT